MGGTGTRGSGEGAGRSPRAGSGTRDVATESVATGARSQRRAAAILLAPVRAARAAARYLNAVLGGQDYARYVAHLRRVHPDRPIPSESEYWRERHAAADRNPGTRCC
ncbi:YbdD/YjiX family protein [Nocardia veterana]|uniref:YbdD/YjiX family protein n=1 Tax=Nocardia veterana TaxID=132249 RepID=A0A7X6RJI4_9NOCA|nr:YbdD/YjiX family protein [Nocardia veterana]